MRRPMRASVLAVLSAATLVAGCGLKPDVADQLYRAGPGGLGPGSGELGAVGPDGQPADGAPGTGDGTGTGPGGTGGTGSGPGGPGGTGGTGSGDGGTGSGPGGTGSAPKAGPNDKNGVTAKEVHIGLHAPVTGAAAIPQGSFERAVGVYAKYINDRGGIHGRKLVMHFEDDQFRPDSAVGKCKKLAQQIKVFTIIGGAGSDQIDACARYSNSVGVPYLSAGVHETRPSGGSLNALGTYYATSLTYEQQAPMITRQMRSLYAGQKVALVVADNDSLHNYFAVQRASLTKAFGADKLYATRIEKKDESQARTIAAKLCNSKAKAAAWNAAPAMFIAVTKAMDCTIRFFGPGLTNGLKIVAQGACSRINGARFFSPFPQLDRINQMDPAFAPAYRAKNEGDAPDDIGIAIWGIEKLVGQMLQATGKDLGRAKFMDMLNSGKTFNNGVYPAVKFAANKRFGGSAMHLLEAKCETVVTNSTFTTKQTYVRP